MTSFVTGLSIIGFLVIEAAKGIAPVAAFFLTVVAPRDGIMSILGAEERDRVE